MTLPTEHPGYQGHVPGAGHAPRRRCAATDRSTWAVRTPGTGENLALAIVERCRAEGLAGVTVSRGIMGFGKHSLIHRAHLLGLSEDLPERIDIVDRREQIARSCRPLEAMLDGGLMVIQDVKVLTLPAPRQSPDRETSLHGRRVRRG